MKRVFVLGIDGMCLPVWRRLAEHALIPFLSQTVRTLHPVNSTTPPHSAPAWTSIATSLNPGRHGVLDFWKRVRDVPATARPLVTSSTKPTFWEAASQMGYRVGIFNYPLSYPPRPVDGFWVCGLNTPPSASDFVYPGTLAPELSDFRVDADLLNEFQHARTLTLAQRRNALAEITAVLRNHIDTGLRVLASPAAEGVSLYVFVLTATDRFLHLFWDTVFNDGNMDNSLRNAVHEFWRVLDTGIRQWIEAAKPDTIIMTSDHGFCECPEYAFNCSKWLADSGLIPKDAPAHMYQRIGQRISQHARIKAVVRSMLPRLAIRTIKDRLQNDAGHYYATASSIIPEALYGTTFGLSVNPKGRQSAGVVTAVEAEQLLRDIIARASELRTKDGRSIIGSCRRANEVWWGEYLSEYPDLVLNLEHQYGCSIGSLDPRLIIPVKSVRTGDHHSVGMLGLSGDNVSLDQQPEHPVWVWDVAPIALHLLGTSVPSYYDGRVPSGLAGEPHYTDLITDTDFTANQYSALDAEAITNRLRGLGYVE